MEKPNNVLANITQFVWLTELTEAPRWRRFTVRFIRIFYAVLRDLADGQLTLRAMSLVYTTLLSIVPLLAVSFSVLKAFGVHNQIGPILTSLLAPLGERGSEITTNIIGFVENMKVGVLGAVGVAMLFYTVVALMQKIESAFNYTWRVTQSRPLSQRFSDYLSVLMIGPVLIFTAIGLTGTMLNNDFTIWLSEFDVFGILIKQITRLLPYFLIICAFTFVYIFIPNTKVTFKAALIGGVISGVLWETSGWLFASFVVASGQHAAVYSAFATLMLLLIWLHLGWIILLVGASIAFYVQNPEYLSSTRSQRLLSNEMKERLALLVMTKIAERYYRKKPAYTAKVLASQLKTPCDILCRILDALERKKILKQSNDKIPVYLPAKPLDEMTLSDVFGAIRQANEDKHLNSKKLPHHPEVARIFNALDQCTSQVLSHETIKSLVGKL
jgi:membrane protein